MGTRIDALTDGVFAIAMTLLVIEIHVPAGDAPLFPALAHSWPSIVAYAVSFFHILTYWLFAHAYSDAIPHGRQLEGTTYVLQGIYLMAIAFVPFPTAVMASRVESGIDVGSAVAFYSAAMMLPAFGGTLIATHLERRGHVPARQILSVRARAFGPVAYVIAAGVGFVAPVLSLAIFVAAQVYYGRIVMRLHLGRRG